MRMRLSWLAAAAACAAPAAAPAQLAPGLSGSSTTSYMNGTEYWETLRSFGACFAKQSEDKAVALISTPYDSKEEMQAYRAISKRSREQACLMDTSIGAPVTLVRGAIAEGLLRKGYAVPAELVLTAPAPGTTRTLSDAARCYVAGHRADAMALIERTVPGSKKERAALNAMSSDFWMCLPKKAQKAAFNPTQIRYRLAEALLRMPATTAAAPAAQEQ
jgi:hypothetical protein